jgi:L-2-hydroxyglutarate oxidase LhgO
VYPVPNPTNPFLGVHFTLTVSGAIKIGPTAIPIIGKEQYKFRDIPALQDFKSSGRAIKGLFSGSPINLLQLAMTELPKISTKRLVSEAMELVPSVSKNIKWNSKSPGIRAQLVNMKNKSFEMDYVVEQNGKFTHILNAVSPGWTSAIPFAKYVVKNFIA